LGRAAPARASTPARVGEALEALAGRGTALPLAAREGVLAHGQRRDARLIEAKAGGRPRAHWRPAAPQSGPRSPARASTPARVGEAPEALAPAAARRRRAPRATTFWLRMANAPMGRLTRVEAGRASPRPAVSVPPVRSWRRTGAQGELGGARCASAPGGSMIPGEGRALEARAVAARRCRSRGRSGCTWPTRLCAFDPTRCGFGIIDSRGAFGGPAAAHSAPACGRDTCSCGSSQPFCPLAA